MFIGYGMGDWVGYFFSREIQRPQMIYMTCGIIKGLIGKIFFADE